MTLSMRLILVSLWAILDIITSDPSKVRLRKILEKRLFGDLNEENYNKFLDKLEKDLEEASWIS